jgi:hypothetical protein
LDGDSSSETSSIEALLGIVSPIAPTMAAYRSASPPPLGNILSPMSSLDQAVEESSTRVTPRTRAEEVDQKVAGV